MSVHDRIESLRAKKAVLETAIESESRRLYPNGDQISRMKREKLKIKDELTSMDDSVRH